jgi:phosphonopyruvate decarboxylase
MDAEAFWRCSVQRGLTFYSGVPDSTLLPLYDALPRQPDVRYVPAAREDAALGVASAAYFAGGLGGVLMQNSGLGNIVNGLTSFNLLYKVPALLVIGWRGCGGEPNDAPEHWIMGAKTTELLDLLGVPWEAPAAEDVELALDSLLHRIEWRSVPCALIVRPGAIT